MMRNIFRCFVVFILIQPNCLQKKAVAQACSDKSATAAAQKLYKNLFALQDKYTIFGQQDALAYGVGWRYIAGQSDVKLVVDDNPGVYGWDIGGIELGDKKNLDSVPFNLMKEYIIGGYERGAAVTISWHARNPLTGGNSWDTTHGTVRSILPGGTKHDLYKTWLDKVAGFMNDLKDKNGESIPILFRPFHEMTGNWFWWCKNASTPDEFKAVWRFTVNYLRTEKKLHQLIYVYNTADFKNEAEFLACYAGDDVADVLSFDLYQHGVEEASRTYFVNNLSRQLDLLCKIAATKNKMATLAETGLEAIPDPTWWTGTLWPAIKDYPISYVLVWRNHGFMKQENKMHYYGVYPGQASEADFKKWYSFPQVLFEKKIKKQNIYK